MIQLQRHRDIPLLPTLADQFASNLWWASQLLFTRDASGTITGFYLSGGRVKNLPFVKRT
ncbi:MAG: hypothetical protein KF832_31775 [Caldilineaceae bacterium]|nr:hypothetical protein [Caldilineaceae bacterium]